MVEEVAAAAVFGDEGFAQLVDVAEGRLAVALQLADHRAGVQLVTTGETQALGQHSEVDTVLGMAVNHSVHCTVNVQQHAVLTAPLGKTGVSGEATSDVVVHDDGLAQFFSELGALIHLFRSCSGAVEVVPLLLACFLLRQVGCFSNELETVLPTLERLGVDVFVVLGEVQTAA